MWMFSMARNCSSVVFWMTLSQLKPAQLTIRCRWSRKPVSAASTICCGTSGSIRSPRIIATRSGVRDGCFQVLAKTPGPDRIRVHLLRLHTSRCTIALPIPRPPPVTMAVLPVSVNGGSGSDCVVLCHHGAYSSIKRDSFAVESTLQHKIVTFQTEC